MKKTNSLILWFYTLKFVEWGNKIETDIENREAKLLVGCSTSANYIH